MRSELLVVAMTVLSLAACGGPGAARDDAGAADASTADASTADASTADSGANDAGPMDAGPPDAGSTDAGSTHDAGSSNDAGATQDGGSTSDAGQPDAGLRPPPPLPTYSGGTCPTLIHGTTENTGRNLAFMSAGDSREFVLLVPSSYTPAKRYPVVFGYHWLNASAGSVVRDAELTTAIEQYEFIAVVPENKMNGSMKAYQFDWPFVETMFAPKELTFFEDALTCVSQQFSVDLSHVHVFGASAGGLWTAYLSTQPQVERVASVISISGGLGEVLGVWQIPWVARPNKFPALVVWGGTTDWLGVNFDQASKRYRDALRADGHPVVTCVHSAGHAIPPWPSPTDGGTKFAPFWEYFHDHPLGMPSGFSPYTAGGLPPTFAGLPGTCAVVP